MDSATRGRLRAQQQQPKNFGSRLALPGHRAVDAESRPRTSTSVPPPHAPVREERPRSAPPHPGAPPGILKRPGSRSKSPGVRVCISDKAEVLEFQPGSQLSGFSPRGHLNRNANRTQVVAQVGPGDDLRPLAGNSIYTPGRNTMSRAGTRQNYNEALRISPQGEFLDFDAGASGVDIDGPNHCDAARSSANDNSQTEARNGRLSDVELGASGAGKGALMRRGGREGDSIEQMHSTGDIPAAVGDNFSVGGSLGSAGTSASFSFTRTGGSSWSPAAARRDQPAARTAVDGDTQQASKRELQHDCRELPSDASLRRGRPSGIRGPAPTRSQARPQNGLESSRSRSVSPAPGHDRPERMDCKPAQRLSGRNAAEAATGSLSANIRTKAAAARVGGGALYERVICIDKTDGGCLGAKVENEGPSLLINEISSGLIEDWNRENPDRRVEEGDRIVSVNGLHGDATWLLEEIMRDTVLRLRIEGRSRDDNMVVPTSPSAKVIKKEVMGHILELFDYFDAERSGMMDKDELTMVMRTISPEIFRGGKSPSALNKLFESLDEEGTGLIDFRKFVEWAMGM